MTKPETSVLADIGLDSWPSFLKDRWFGLALLAGILVWLVLWITLIPTFKVEQDSLGTLVFTTVIWYPVLEEILFRGILQGAFIKESWGRKSFAGLSTANLLASLLFVCAHFFYYPAIWAIAVLFPSLVFGFFRDRYSSIYPCIFLHVFYNSGFITLNILAP